MNEKEFGSPQSAGALHTPQEIQDLIRKRAYELFENLGKQDGHGLDDWILAESEVMRILAPEERLHLRPA